MAERQGLKAMTNADIEANKQNASSPLRPAHKQNQGSDGSSEKSTAPFDELEVLLDGERELVRELIRALREIRYGSIVLTVHDGQVVEINKSIRIRKSRASKKE
jgi:hypothetical protein